MKPFAKAFEAEIGQLDALGFGAAKAWHAKDRPL